MPRELNTIKRDESCVLLFIKYPEAGKVKTRLASEIGDINAAELYKNFVMDILTMFGNLEYQLRIHFSPEGTKDKFIEWLGDQYCYTPQNGRDLGESMKNGFIHAFSEGFRGAVLIGSDSPDLPAGVVDKAFLSLENHDVVIGQAFDGGYYLIGFNDSGFLPEPFYGIQWSTNTVFQRTMEILQKKGCKIYELPKWRDIDNASDLKDLIRRNKNNKHRIPRTMLYIEKELYDSDDFHKILKSHIVSPHQ
jgi:hypothetical protein